MWPLYGASAAVIALLVAGALRSRRRSAGPAAVSLCLIVRNQADRIEGLVSELVGLSGALRAHVADVIVVDDASTDGTGMLLLRLGRRHPGVKILRWPDDTPDGQHVLDAACALCEGAWILLGRVTSGTGLRASPHPGS